MIAALIGYIAGAGTVLGVAVWLGHKAKPNTAPQHLPSATGLSMNGNADSDESFPDAVRRILDQAETRH